ncbi:hypothetical protein KFL_007700030 [Klebsormidium nitens]|uniref:BTB domain-containing protein n=1 Tax=Klebsormidium nitens TaxID=105231 RepID=A0A1Y1IRH8_KLENI|nr:hypothetical protein KFL_007700030 [Klebsormidium nitens]|eukprot:GAQ91346.1 hypothetical protein KFL_007700030 [Klebsormidium nitens]
MDEEPPSEEAVRQAWRAWRMHGNPLSVFWIQWRSFLDHQLAKCQAELQAQRQWRARILSRTLSGWTVYRQQREAAANLLRQWKEKRALEDLKAPPLQASPRFSINHSFPQTIGPLGSASGQAGLGLLATSLGALFEDLQGRQGGDIVIEVLGSSRQLPGCEEHKSWSQSSDRASSAVVYANACIVCQRVPYFAAAVRFASQKDDERTIPLVEDGRVHSGPSTKLCVSREECSAAGVRAVLEWAYTGSFTAWDWRQLAEALQAGSYLGALEVVQLSQEALLRLAAAVGKELERGGQSPAARELWRSVAGALVSSRNFPNDEVGPLLPALDERLRVGEDGALLSTPGQAGEGHVEDRVLKNATSRGTDWASVKKSSGLAKETADFVVEGLTVLSSCGEEGAVSSFLESACPSLESVLLTLLQLDLRLASNVLGMLLERLDHLRGLVRERTELDRLVAVDPDGAVDVGVLVILHRWWSLHPKSRLAPARALLEEHVCLGALGINTLEELIGQCRKSAVEGPMGAGNSQAATLVRLEEVEAAYRFALRVGNEYGKSRRLMRQTVAQWRSSEQSRAWRSWHEFCRDGLGTSRVVLAKRAMRVWSLRSAAGYFAAWRQAAVEGRIEERQRLALWKWQKACQKLLQAKQRMSNA